MRPSRPRLARLVGQGLSDSQIAEQLDVCARTVFNWRKRYKIRSQWAPEPAPAHGRTAYTDGRCRCPRCRAEHRAAFADWASRAQAESARAERYGLSWTPEEDQILLELAPRAASLKLARTYSACVNRHRRLKELATA